MSGPAQLRSASPRTAAFALAASLLGVLPDLTRAAELPFTVISGSHSGAVGIDYFEPQNQLVLTAFYPNGQPRNFDLLRPDGAHSAFSSVSGITDEIKIASARSPQFGGLAGGPFSPGTTFSGTNASGTILKIEPNGSANSTWSVVPNAATAGFFRGSLHVDTTGVFGGDLIGVTSQGNAYRVNGAGLATKIGPSVLTHLEGVMVVPNDPAIWGGLAGKIIAGAEQLNRLYAFGADNSVMFWTVNVQVEDLDLILPNQNFFGVNYGQGRLVGIKAADFAAQDLVGKILATEESNGRLHTLSWNFATNQPQFEQITLKGGTGVVLPTQWEHVTFAPAGVREIRTTLTLPDVTVSGAFGNRPHLTPVPITGTALARYNYVAGSLTGNPPEAQVNQGVMSLLEDDVNALSLLIVLDKAGDTTGGSLTLQLTGSGADLSASQLLVTDDPSTTGDAYSYSNGSGLFTWTWAAGQTDGIVLRLPMRRPISDPLSNWSIAFSTISSTGLDGFSFIADGQIIDLGSSGFNFTLTVPEPALPAILLAGLATIVIFRRRPRLADGQARSSQCIGNRE